jgi:branched-chain amino acid transport system ATP-binding protein
MPHLELNNVSKHFGHLAAVDQVDLQVEKGEILGLVGPNGSGKTTLINVISGYYTATRGSIYFEGHKILGLRPDLIAKRGIVRTFQSNVLYTGLTVLDSMMISSYLQHGTNHLQSFFNTKAAKKDDEQVVNKVMELLGMLDMANDIYSQADGLSHGKQRMLGIAMSLIAGPSVLMLDEPTTGMNHKEAMFVVDKIKKINDQGITVVLIEHNMKVLLGVATRVCCLSFGNKIADGNPEEVMNKQEVIEAYLGTEIL